MSDNRMTPPDNHPDRDQQLEAIVADYIRACETGTAPNRNDILKRHPELADEMRQFFANRDRLERIVAPIQAEDQFTNPHSAVDQIGLCIGPYTLVQKLGEGGMGEVWVAKQSSPVKRKVAIKLIKGGINSREILNRFEQERQALAMMDHPNIAKIFDGGVIGVASSLPEPSVVESGDVPPRVPTAMLGQPYFVMELVNGLPLTKYCDEARLTLRERLQLFVPICQAVQHAHQKGIVHRDLKPSNILVTIYDGQPVPKVIDFGVAKATGGKLTDESLSTQFGAVVGTLEYMSPEQAGFSSQDIDTRADIYSLGVILYELLTGLRPIDGQRLRKAALAEMIRIIQEEEPSKPSMRLSSEASLPSLAAMRQTEPKRLTALLRGELDWVVMKCLEKSRDRRYESATGLARDVERYLADEPVEACPPSFRYRLGKTFRKNQTVVGVVSGFLILLFAATVLTSILAMHARQAEQVASEERNRAEAERQKADDQRVAAESERQRAEAEKMTAQAVRDFLQIDLLQQADGMLQAEALKLSGTAFAVKSNPTIHELLDRATDQLTPERIEARFPNMPSIQAEILNAVGSSYRAIGEDKDAFKLLARAVELYRRERTFDVPAARIARRELAIAHLRLGHVDESISQLETLRDDCISVVGLYHRDAFRVQNELANAYGSANRLESAISLLRQLKRDAITQFGPEEFEAIYATSRLGIFLNRARQTNEAVQQLETVWAVIRRKYRPDHPAVAAVMWELSIAYKSSNREQEALNLLEACIESWEATGDPFNPATWYARHELASGYLRSEKSELAVKMLEQNIVAASPPLDEVAIEALYSGYMSVNRYDDALVQIRRVRELVETRKGSDHRSYQSGRIEARIGLVLDKQEKYSEAESFLVGGYEKMVAHIHERPSYDMDTVENTLAAIINIYKLLNKPDDFKKWSGLQWDLSNTKMDTR